MAIDSINDRYLAYQAGLDLIEPQIKGCINKLNDDISPDLKAAFQARLDFLQDRKAKINAATAALDAAVAADQVLEEDGFPNVPNMEIAESLFMEIKEEGVADDAAAAGFEVVALASNMSITLGSPTDKP